MILARRHFVRPPFFRQGGAVFPSACPRVVTGIVAGSKQISPQRRASRVAGRIWSDKNIPEQEKSGRMSTSHEDESILFVNNLFPPRIGNFLRRQWQTDQDLADLLQKFNSSSLGLLDPIGLVKAAIPETLPITVTEIIPRLKDGGAFVKFTHPHKMDPGQVEEALSKSLRDRPLKPWFSLFQGIEAGLVRGVPWLEDLHRLPRSRLRVEFVAPAPGAAAAAAELSQEALYGLFRKYGRMYDIVSQDPDSKTLPRFAYLDFVLVRDAIMARNCLHGFVVTDPSGKTPVARLRLSYAKKIKTNAIWTWLSSHPRVVFPVLAALLAAVTVVVFDPIRQFSIRSHIQQTYRVTNSRVVKWFKSQTSDMLSTLGNGRKKAENSVLNAVWMHRRDLVDALRAWLLESSDSFIVVQGPRGSGKRELVLDEALGDRRNVLVVDCKAVVEGRGESGTISKLAAAVGYRPVFSWANSISSLVDLGIQGTTGVKSGFSETLESQVVKILQTTAAALKEVSLAERGRLAKDRGLSDDAFLEAHPEHRAVVVVDNFLNRHDGSSIVYDKVADWAAALVQNNIAHVIFLTDDSSYSKALSRVQPDRVFRQISLGDLSADIAKKFIMTRLQGDRDDAKKAGRRGGAGGGGGGGGTITTTATKNTTEKAIPLPDLSDLDRCVEVIGGRLTDLESLARRLKNGQDPRQATDEIIDQAAAEIVKVFLLGKPTDTTPRHWSPPQAWHLITALASAASAPAITSAASPDPSVPYASVVLAPVFDKAVSSPAPDAEAAVANLVDAELVNVSYHRGRPRAVHPAKPIYLAAFALLVGDPALRARMDYAVLDELVAIHAKAIGKAEDELALLGTLPKQPAEVGERASYLLRKLETGQRGVAAAEREMAALKKQIGSEDVGRV